MASDSSIKRSDKRFNYPYDPLLKLNFNWYLIPLLTFWEKRSQNNKSLPNLSKAHHFRGLFMRLPENTVRNRGLVCPARFERAAYA